jgi:hypothetical protein
VERTEIVRGSEGIQQNDFAEDQQALYLAGMNLIAEKFYRLARDKQSPVEELRTYAEILSKYFEQQIKRAKTDLMLRHLELLETKANTRGTGKRSLA